MKIVICSVRDKVVGNFGGPLGFVSFGQAERWFGDECREGDMAKHRTDFEMYHIGEQDSDTGVITAEPVPRLVARGEAFVAVPDELAQRRAN